MNLIIYILIFLVLVVIYLSINFYYQEKEINILEESVNNKLNNVALKNDLDDVALKSDLNNFALKNDISNLNIFRDYAKNRDLNNYALISKTPTKADISGLTRIYALKTDLNKYAELSNVPTKTDISNLSNIFALKSDLSGLVGSSSQPSSSGGNLCIEDVCLNKQNLILINKFYSEVPEHLLYYLGSGATIRIVGKIDQTPIYPMMLRIKNILFYDKNEKIIDPNTFIFKFGKVSNYYASTGFFEDVTQSEKVNKLKDVNNNEVQTLSITSEFPAININFNPSIISVNDTVIIAKVKIITDNVVEGNSIFGGLIYIRGPPIYFVPTNISEQVVTVNNGIIEVSKY